MKALPFQRNGATYCTGPDGEQFCTGSQMGRRDVLPDRSVHCKLRLLKMRMVDSCYDQGGAYWGMGTPLYCAFGDTADTAAEIYVRAKSRTEAKALVRGKLPNARFYN